VALKVSRLRNIFSSVIDLAMFAEFLLAGTENVLTPGNHALIPAKLVNSNMVAGELWYGYGVMINDRIRIPSDLASRCTR
jgi:hypothetical protein